MHFPIKTPISVAGPLSQWPLFPSSSSPSKNPSPSSYSSNSRSLGKRKSSSSTNSAASAPAALSGTLPLSLGSTPRPLQKESVAVSSRMRLKCSSTEAKFLFHPGGKCFLSRMKTNRTTFSFSVFVNLPLLSILKRTSISATFICRQRKLTAYKAQQCAVQFNSAACFIKKNGSRKK